jgi:hypothetical protein
MNTNETSLRKTVSSAALFSVLGGGAIAPSPRLFGLASSFWRQRKRA